MKGSFGPPPPLALERGDAARLRAVMAAPTSAKRDRAGIQKNYANDRCIRL
jgi:hypothetical protein